ncbi:effector-associated constant component EACC1 [Saccharothrix algeriensis]|uniref:Uncharacterized protein n=1 Tax=Saccharothrix algeriensis TaxID=173560 RepID=A0A8T8HYF9_9PSEU|nr:hypothetical protein [Saccharothrix algeriensis]MBM7815004.1 hypothetical protein [Saccharothrix algeriensis]QTR03260.1 hypothetical protein J7S33_30695 [Saccharothrix algeriensis]
MTGADAVVVRVASGRYAADHPGWLAQVALLERRLRGVAPHAGADGPALRVEVDRPREPGTGPVKGLVEVTAVVLASSQVIRAAAVVLREWARQDAGREITVEVEQGGRRITGTGRGRAGIEAVRRVLAEALGDEPPSSEGEAEPADDDR